ncbi:hypothetical protein MUA95_09750 [Staphylococcus agnetis]|uniref:Replicative helicase inhibitor G39P N-terminal domain-containing protein n=1 Tax=Staphylococcus agnetis TaxID=985762 RepID=A0ABD7TRZ3_9STAP|nr:hypothetical protein [Staphylococcus agnetis]UXU56836.1 hypothetical protein MUA95_09750 [Staphylococcus agnetis]
MKKSEALHIIEVIAETYNMSFNERKIDIWIDILSKEGDFDQSMKKLQNFIKQSKYKPTIADVLATKPKAFEIKEKPVEETHQYKLENDPEYARKWQEVKRKGRAFIKELRSHD